jgi:hypothetical protein
VQRDLFARRAVANRLGVRRALVGQRLVTDRQADHKDRRYLRKPDGLADPPIDGKHRYDLQLDLARHHKGPLVIEAPPKVLGIVDDFWYHWVADIGITGADKGRGGKYLVLPPGCSGEIPAGYFVLKPNTYGTWLLLRATSSMVRQSPRSNRSERI